MLKFQIFYEFKILIRWQNYRNFWFLQVFDPKETRWHIFDLDKTDFLEKNFKQLSFDGKSDSFGQLPVFNSITFLLGRIQSDSLSSSNLLIFRKEYLKI